MNLPIDQIRTLLAVVDEGTFEAAARRLHVTPSAVSQRVKELERRVGRVLVLRSKPARLTDSGMAMVRFGRQVAQLERDTRGTLGMADTGEPTQLPIAVNADSLATWILPALTRVAEQLPACFDLHREDQDHTAELLRQGRVMAAVTSSPEPVQGCSVRKLGRMRYRPMASPAFVDQWLSSAPLQKLITTAPMVVFDRRDDLQDRFIRKLTRSSERSPVRHYVPSSEVFVQAVAAGLGWGMIPEGQAWSMADGALVDVDEQRPIDVPLYWQQWKLDSPALAVLSDAVAEVAGSALLT